MPKEEDVEQTGENEGKSSEEPDNEGEEHARQDDYLLVILLGED